MHRLQKWLLILTVAFVSNCQSVQVGEELCGNGQLDENELCDIGIFSGPSACPRPADCQDGAPCTQDGLEGERCLAHCTHQAVTEPVNGDGCCPTGATALDDNDCSTRCGDDNCDANESCNTCPSDCDPCPPQCTEDLGLHNGGIAKLGDPCEQANLVACAGHAQSEVRLCDESGCEWIVAPSCELGTLCDSVDGSCKPPVQACVGKAPGDLVCQGPDLHLCGSDLVTSEVVQCGLPALCQLHVGSQCALCQDGEHRCIGAELQACLTDHLGFEFAQTCASEALCNADAGTCTDKVCLENQYHCNQDALERCNSIGSGYDPVDTCDPGLCDALGKQCDICISGATSCKDDHTVNRCSQNGQQLLAESCPSQTPLCILEGQCVQCVQAADCPTPDDPCKAATCDAGNCGTKTRENDFVCGNHQICFNGSCVCDVVHEDCDNQIPGCETDIQSDSENCGRCGHSCLEGECVSQYCQPVTLASSHALSRDMTSDLNYLYFADGASNKIMKISKNGGNPEIMANNDDWLAFDLRNDLNYVYWTDAVAIWKIAKAGGTREQIVYTGGNTINLVLYNIYLFYTISTSSGTEIWRVTTSSPYSPTLEYSMDNTWLIHAMAINSLSLFWTRTNTNDWRAEVQRKYWGSNPTTIASDVLIRDDVLWADEQDLFWVAANAKIYNYHFNTSATTLLVDVGNNVYYQPYDMERDDQYLYFPDAGTGKIYKVSLAYSGTTPETIGWNFDDPTDIEIDDCCLYIRDDNGLYRIAK